MSDKHIDDVTGTETTGHEWDGIKELNTPLPRWWLWTFYACIVFALGYSVAYPAWPMLTSATVLIFATMKPTSPAPSLSIARGLGVKTPRSSTS